MPNLNNEDLAIVPDAECVGNPQERVLDRRRRPRRPRAAARLDPVRPGVLSAVREAR
jgi:hypothetical protein